jgi:hypothetical protein
MQTAPAQKVTLSMADHRLGEWGVLTEEQLAALTKEDWGWTRDTNLWAYSGASDLALDDRADRCMRRSHVVAQLKGVATKFKRATVVLRAQSSAKTWKDCVSEAPQLLANMQEMLRKAGRMYHACGGDADPDEWLDAVLFFNNWVWMQVDIRKGLRDEIRYDRDAWNTFRAQWKAVEAHWLINAEEE